MAMNLDYLYQVADNNEAFIAELLSVLRKNLVEFPVAMQQAFDTQQWEDLRNIAHKFKSCVAYAGIKEFNHALIALELSEENNLTPAQIQSNLQVVCQFAKQMLAEIDQLLVKYH
ncbi:Hpt domain-containing protein [Rhodoflexus caldus]|uniref:Hpt domain-containing protein n=1 Tax=Rhodoflexus caldus TaxID=2891236 RepID=UPI002029BE7B|nr:Hpt domain-containing protein [Rhodoflexus caldus]